MFSVNHQKFMEMDELSLQKVPIFSSSTFWQRMLRYIRKVKLKNQA